MMSLYKTVLYYCYIGVGGVEYMLKKLQTPCIFKAAMQCDNYTIHVHPEFPQNFFAFFSRFGDLREYSAD